MSFDYAELTWQPQNDPLRQYLDAVMMGRCLRAERRIHDFMQRTGLPLSEVHMVFFQKTGESYPQWKGAVELLPIICAPED